MSGHLPSLVPVVRRFTQDGTQRLPTQDGWDWPLHCTDERWPVAEEWRGPATEYWRAMKALGEDV